MKEDFIIGKKYIFIERSKWYESVIQHFTFPRRLIKAEYIDRDMYDGNSQQKLYRLTFDGYEITNYVFPISFFKVIKEKSFEQEQMDV